jgi:hypothetical protein
MQICCSSPERFLRAGRSGVLEAKPIKGTARRHADAVADAAAAAALAASEKDQAENLMIVDLLRNDLGRVCEVPPLPAFSHMMLPATCRTASEHTPVTLSRISRILLQLQEPVLKGGRLSLRNLTHAEWLSLAACCCMCRWEACMYLC